VYSVLKEAHLVEIFGMIYFLMGAFIYKYQLLYAMDHRQFSTGQAWPMMCERFIVGLVVFQAVMAGQLALSSALKRSVIIIPLLVLTIWFGVFYRRTYEPLMKNIALRTLREAREDAAAEAASLASVNGDEGRAGEEVDVVRNQSSDEEAPVDVNKRFVNPSLVLPLEQPWIAARTDGAEGNGRARNGREDEVQNVWEDEA